MKSYRRHETSLDTTSSTLKGRIMYMTEHFIKILRNIMYSMKWKTDKGTLGLVDETISAFLYNLEVSFVVV